MTEEQIKSLKKGDKITVVFIVNNTNDEYLDLSFEDGIYYSVSTKKWWGLLKHATLVTPPPTFDVGDTVRIINDPLSGRVHGAHYAQILEGRVGKVAHVRKSGERDDEGETDDEGTVWIRCEGNNFNWGISPHCVALVKKAVKDKYRVGEAEYEWCVFVGTEAPIVAGFSKEKHPDAKAAAEAECARLNAEWRKQQEQKGE